MGWDLQIDFRLLPDTRHSSALSRHTMTTVGQLSYCPTLSRGPDTHQSCPRLSSLSSVLCPSGSRPAPVSGVVSCVYRHVDRCTDMSPAVWCVWQGWLYRQFSLFSSPPPLLHPSIILLAAAAWLTALPTEAGRTSDTSQTS